MNSVQQTIARLLSKQDAPLTFAQCQEHIAAIDERLNEIRTRCDLIDPEPSAKGKLAEERQRIAETGTPAQLIELDNEYALLEAEDFSLCRQRDKLRQRAEAARAEEALGHAQDALRKFPKVLAAAEKAIQAQAEAIAALEALQGEIRTHRHTAAAVGHNPPAMDEESFDRLAAALGWTTPPQPQTFPENRAIALKRSRQALLEHPVPESPTIHPDFSRRTSFVA